MTATEQKPKKLYQGVVISDKMDKTVTARYERTFVHPKLHKVLKVTKNYKVHDETNSAKEGDVIEFYQVRPLSKTKYMCLNRIVTSAQRMDAE